MPKLTKRFVESVKPQAKDVVIFDAMVPGFGLRVLPTGVRSYLVQYRNAQRRSRRLTIGKHGAVTVDFARKKARKIVEAARDGKDPVAERRAFLKAPTVSDLLDRYLAEHVEPHNRATTAIEVRRLVECHIRPALGSYKAAAVTSRDVGNLHRSLHETPRQANLVLAVCSKAFRLAETWQDRAPGSNACRDVKRYPEKRRTRFLKAAELTRLGTVLQQATTVGLPWSVSAKKSKSKHLPPVADRRTLYPRATTAAVELLLFTGCRLSEVLNLAWDRVDMNAGELTLDETKSGEPQTVVISAPARRVLTELARLQGIKVTALTGSHKTKGWVLPSRNDHKRPLSKAAIEQAWQRIRMVAKLEDVHLHDLRHTVGTVAGRTGANAFLVRDLLRHSDLATTSIYVNRDDNPVRTLSDQVAQQIDAGLSGRPVAEVVPLKRA